MKEHVKDKKTAIMGAALKLFTERGFHGTSTAQISKNAGVATGTLFNYFPTKEDLINSLYFEVKGNLGHSMGGVGLEAETTFQDKLKRIWSNLVNWGGVNNQEEFLFVGQFCSSPYITKFTRDEVMKEYVFLHNFVDEGIKRERLEIFLRSWLLQCFIRAAGR